MQLVKIGMIKSIFVRHTTPFLSTCTDPKHVSTHVWQNLECPQDTEMILALSALQHMSHRLPVFELGCGALSDKLGAEPCKYRNLPYSRRHLCQHFVYTLSYITAVVIIRVCPYAWVYGSSHLYLRLLTYLLTYTRFPSWRCLHAVSITRRFRTE